MKKYELAIFDLDGTLLDTSEGIAESVMLTIRDMGLQIPSKEMLPLFIGPPMHIAFAKMYGLDERLAFEASTIFRCHYENYGLLKAKPYEGIVNLLGMLKHKGLKICVATNKKQSQADFILEHFGFSPLLDAVFGTDAHSSFNKLDLIYKCTSKFCINNEQSVFISDTDMDAAFAEKGGVDFIGVTYGFGFHYAKEVSLYKNVAIVTSINDLMIFFEESCL